MFLRSEYWRHLIAYQALPLKFNAKECIFIWKKPFMKRQYTQLFAFALMLMSVSMPCWSQGIVGGEYVEEGKYPFMVGVVEAQENNLIKAIECGATVIGDRWVLTAAHCLTTYDGSGQVISTAEPEDIEVLVGTYDLESPNSGYRRLSVEKIYINPDYRRVNFLLPDGSMSSIPDNDIALLRLKENPLVPPVKLPEVNDDSWEIDGLPVRVMGWGMDNTRTYTRSSSLKEATIELIDRDICREYDFYDKLVSSSMICAGLSDPGQSPKGGARGDSGGPLVFETGKGWLQLGIMSWGLSYTDYQKPGVYQRVNAHLNWIDEVTRTTSTDNVLGEGHTRIWRYGDILKVEFKKDIGETMIQVYSMEGRLMLQKDTEGIKGNIVEMLLPFSTERALIYLHSEEGQYTAVR